MKRTAPLSNFEQKIWDFLWAYFPGHTWSPTRKEIAEGIKPKSTPQQVDYTLKNMEKKGWIEFKKKGWRNIIDPTKSR